LISQSEINEMASSKNVEDRKEAAQALRSAFSLLLDKEQGWQDLHKLTQDEDRGVRVCAADALERAFGQIPDKTQAWQDLHKLTLDEDLLVRVHAAFSLGRAFRLIPDKALAWQDLHKLTLDEDRRVRWGAAFSLGTAFSQVPNKVLAWQDLHNLAQDEGEHVRAHAAFSLGRAFSLIPDKALAWQDLHKLTLDEDKGVRRGAAFSLGAAFSQVPNKVLAWQDLLRLTQDQDRNVRIYAYHSLGRVSVHNASEADDKNTIRSELEAAVEFFEKSSAQERPFSNLASFCRPFYRSYLALTFQGASGDEVQKYLVEAKDAIGGSENKKELFGAVENLAKALEETQKLKIKSVEHIQSDLKAYQWYCDRAAEHMAAAEESAPGAVGLLRKCNPIIEERIEATIAGIQKAAREICQVTRRSGTKYEEAGAQINQEAKSLSSEDPIKAFKSSTRIATILREFCGLLPRDKRGHGCEIVDEIETEQDLSGRLSKIELALTYLQPNIDLAAHESVTKNKLEEMHIDIKSMHKKLNTIIFDLAKIKIGSGDIVTNLWAIRSELNKVAELEKSFALGPKSISTDSTHPIENQIQLAKLIETKVFELEEILKTKATNGDNRAILNQLGSLKPSAGFEWLGRIADVIAIFDASIKVFQVLKQSGMLF
jgi:HEAT repeat protein